MRRHSISRENLLNHIDLIDTLMLVDNSGKDGELFATVEKGQIQKHIHPVVTWGDDLLQQIQQRINKSTS